jgi:hypothetical protein
VLIELMSGQLKGTSFTRWPSRDVTAFRNGLRHAISRLPGSVWKLVLTSHSWCQVVETPASQSAALRAYRCAAASPSGLRSMPSPGGSSTKLGAPMRGSQL